MLFWRRTVATSKHQSNMSFKSNNNNKSNHNVENNKKFCKVCFDAKRPGYDQHFLKSNGLSTGNVVCPYLLSLECKYCKKAGHTVSYCDILAAKNNSQSSTKVQEKPSRAKLYQDEDGWVTKGQQSTSSKSQEGRFYIKGLSNAAPVRMPMSAPAPMFAPRIMFEDDDEEDDEEVPVAAVAQPMGEWAAIAAKKPVKKPLRITTDMLFQSVNASKSVKTAKIETENEIKIVKEAAPWKPIITRNWADDSDSDDE